MIYIVMMAATIIAGSASRTDVASAITSAAATGDTILVPQGTNDWTGGTVTSTKNFLLVAQGPGRTVFTNTGAARFFTLSPASTTARLMFSNINMWQAQNGGEVPSLVIDQPCTNFWFQGGSFHFGSRCLYGTSRLFGLVRNTYFYNCDVAVACENISVDEWALGPRIGTVSMLVAEDCVFEVDEGTMDEQFYGQDASRYCVRRNYFTSADAGATAPVADAHGNWNIGVDGTHLYEFYDNIISNSPSAFQTLHVRGGIFNVTRNQFFNAAEIFRMRNENYSTSGTYDDTHQIENSYWYNNTNAGVTQTSWTPLTDGGLYNWDDSGGKVNVVFSENEGAGVPTFMKATAWASGQSYVSTSPPTFRKHGTPSLLYRCISSHTSGASTEPGVGGDWQTVWTNQYWNVYMRAPASGDPYFPITELTYPHPFVGGEQGGGGGSDTLYRNRGRATRISGVIP